MLNSARNYVVISPAKDEAKYIETTIQAMIRQTVKPSLWVIVDDGSRDGTSEIIERYAREHPWIRGLRLDGDVDRQPGPAVIRAFDAGYKSARDAPLDFIVKLDCDLDFAPDYFERLISKFDEDEKLGIASGIYLENHGGRWQPVKMPAYHAAGASKMLRAKCFRDIGGFVPSRGWDTIDEIKAQVLGWKTYHFEALQFCHLKSEGSGIGPVRTNFMHGEIYYSTGGGTLFFLLKVLHRVVSGRPFIWGSLAMLGGYLSAWAAGKPRLVSDTEARFYRRLLNRRISRGLGRLVGLKPKDEAWSFN